MQNNIPKLRFKEFNDEWQEKSLGEVGSFYYGKSVPKPSVTKEGKTPCVRYGELYSAYKGRIDAIRSYTNLNPSNLKLSKGGELLIPRVGEEPLDFINCSYLPISSVAIGEMVSVYNTEQNVPYLVYYIRGKLRKKFARVVEGGNVSNLYFRYLEKIKIHIPSIPEQEKIAGFLGAVDEKIEKLEKKKKGFEKYKKGVMQAIFSQKIRFKKPDGSNYPNWEEQKFDQVLVSLPTKAHQILNSQFSKQGKFPVVDQGQSKIAGYSDDTSRLFKNIPVIIFGDHTTFLKYIDFNFIVGADGTKVMRSKNNDNLKYLYYALEKYKLIPEGYKRHFSVLTMLKLPIPTIEEQEKIAEFLTSLDNKVELINKELEQAKLFKKSLLQQMFV